MDANYTTGGYKVIGTTGEFLCLFHDGREVANAIRCERHGGAWHDQYQPCESAAAFPTWAECMASQTRAEYAATAAVLDAARTLARAEAAYANRPGIRARLR